MKFTETRKVWADQSTHLQEITAATARSLYLTSGDVSAMGYSVVGTAQVVIELDNWETMVANKVTALKAELQEELAGAEVRQSTLRDKISKLLAITHEVTA